MHNYLESYIGKYGLLCVAMLLLAGCGVLPGKSSQRPVVDYALNAGFPPGASATGNKANGSCLDARVMLPRPAAGFNTSRMAYMEDDNSLRYFAFSQWLDTPAYMLQPLLVVALERSDRFHTVVRSPSPVRSRFILASDNLALVQRFDGSQSTVRLALRVQLIDSMHGRILLDEPLIFSREAPANPAQGVATANTLAAEMMNLLATKVQSAVKTEEFCQPESS